MAHLQMLEKPGYFALKMASVPRDTGKMVVVMYFFTKNECAKTLFCCGNVPMSLILMSQLCTINLDLCIISKFFKLKICSWKYSMNVRIPWWAYRQLLGKATALYGLLNHNAFHFGYWKYVMKYNSCLQSDNICMFNADQNKQISDTIMES